MPQRDHADDHRGRKSLKPHESELLDEAVQRGGRVGDSLIQVVELPLPELAVLVEANRRCNVELELGFVCT